jgi:hypothetical protein
VIRAYDFTVKREQKAPDGYLKNVLIINGQFPGPLIEANWYEPFLTVITFRSDIILGEILFK